MFPGFIEVFAEKVKPNLWINVYNLDSSCFLTDPWCFETPSSTKPTFLNMDFPIEELNVSDFIQDNKLDLGLLSGCLSCHLD